MPKKKQETTITVTNGCMKRIYKLGTEGRPASKQDVQGFQNLLALSTTDLPIVCPYEITVQLVGLEEAHVYMHLADKGIISKKTLCEKLGLKYEGLEEAQSYMNLSIKGRISLRTLCEKLGLEYNE